MDQRRVTLEICIQSPVLLCISCQNVSIVHNSLKEETSLTLCSESTDIFVPAAKEVSNGVAILAPGLDDGPTILVTEHLVDRFGKIGSMTSSTEVFPESCFHICTVSVHEFYIFFIFN